jgi:hypothetical protein
MEAELHLTYDDGEPRCFAEAEKHATWHVAMKAEMEVVEKNGTWELVYLPPSHRAITLKWVFKVKKGEVGALVKNKARLVARGFVQHEGVDFYDAFTPVARMESVSSPRIGSPGGLARPSHGHEVGVYRGSLTADSKFLGFRARPRTVAQMGVRRIYTGSGLRRVITYVQFELLCYLR